MRVIRPRNSAIRPLKLCDQAAEQTQRYIFMNKLIFGNRLPTETQQAETFGVSSLGIREATKALEFRCIIEKRAEWLLEIDPLSPG